MLKDEGEEEDDEEEDDDDSGHVRELIDYRKDLGNGSKTQKDLINKMNQEYNNNMNPANSTEDNSNTLIDEFGNNTLKYVSYCYSLFSFKSRLRLR